MQNNQAIPFNKDNFKQIFSVKFLLVITISVPSAIVADYFNLPLAWFLGPMLVTSVGALIGLKIIIPSKVARSKNPETAAPTLDELYCCLLLPCLYFISSSFITLCI